MSTLKLDYLEAGHGTEIAINVGTTILGTASQFKITGGTSGQALITDGSGGISFGSVDAFPAQSTQRSWRRPPASSSPAPEPPRPLRGSRPPK